MMLAELPNFVLQTDRLTATAELGRYTAKEN